jgi:hypothetical protein
VLQVVDVLGAIYGSGAAGGFYVDFDKHDTYDALSAGKKDGVFVRELPRGTGEVRLATIQAALRVS